MNASEKKYLAAEFPEEIGTLLRICERDIELLEICEDLAAMLQLADKTHPDKAIQENLVVLKQEIKDALARVELSRTWKGRIE